MNDCNPPPNGKTQQKYWSNMNRKRQPLVDIHAWCLMDNHYHLLLSPRNDDIRNISKFVKKLNMGYAKFFNEKYQRTGYLWQGRYKKVKIENDAQFLYIPYYIHLNPLDFKLKHWRLGEVHDLKKLQDILSKYRWSSYLDYIGKNNFPSIINKSYLENVLGSVSNQQKEIENIVSNNYLAEHSNVIET